MVPLIRPNGHLLPEGEGKPFRLVTVFYSVSRKYFLKILESNYSEFFSFREKVPDILNSFPSP